MGVGQGGRTPLHLAAQRGHANVCRALVLKFGADAAALDNVRVPWPLCWRDSWPVGRNNMRHMQHGETPLQLAEANGHEATQKALTECIAGRSDQGVPAQISRGSSDLGEQQAHQTVLWRRTIAALQSAVAAIGVTTPGMTHEQLQQVVSMCLSLMPLSSVFDKWLQRVGDVEATLASTRNKMDGLCNVVAQLAAKVDAGTAMPTDHKALNDAVIARRAGCANCVAELEAVLATADDAAGVDSWCARHPGAGSANAVCASARDFLHRVRSRSSCGWTEFVACAGLFTPFIVCLVCLAAAPRPTSR